MVKQGYKQTEIGVIPEDWDVDTIKSITFSVATGGNYKNSTQISPYPLIKMGNISRGNINVSKIEYVTDTIPSEKDRLIYGDVLFNTRNTPELVGKVAIWKNELPIAYFNSNLLRFNFNLEKSNPFFMNLIFNTEQVISEFKNIAKGTTSVAAIYPQDMLKVLIKIPPLPEQERIAEALSDVDSLISSIEKLITKKKAVKQGAMQELLTGKKRLPGFDREWDDYTIGKMGEFYSGLSGKSKKDFDCGEAHYITFLNVLSNVKIDTSILAAVDVKEGEMQNAVKKGDLFFNTSSETPEEVGMCAVLDEDLDNTYLNSFCFCFRLNDDTHNPLFLSYYLNSAIGRRIMSVLAQGATRYNLSKNNFAETVIKLPTKEEQTAIASILSDMDNEIEALEQKLAKTRQIKQGMMQQLLTGKIRLV